MSQLQVFQCPACGANISYGGGSDISILCQFCGTSIIVPEELRRSGASAPVERTTNSGMYVPEGGLLTGPALNTAIADWLLAQATQQTGTKLAGQPTVYDRMTRATENALRELSTEESVSISLPFLTADSNGPKHFETTLTRRLVEELSQGKLNTPGKTSEKKGLFGF